MSFHTVQNIFHQFLKSILTKPRVVICVPSGITDVEAMAVEQVANDAGAKEVYAACTHPIFSKDATTKIMNSQITEFITTNTIKLPEEKKVSKVVQLSVAKILGQGILNIIDDTEFSKLTLRENNNLIKKADAMHLLFFLVAEVGFEPHGLRVMSPTSYQAALLRDID